MRIVIFLNELGIGGTEKAASQWARGLVQLDHDVYAVALSDGPRRSELATHGVDVHVTSPETTAIEQKLKQLRPDVIHAHAPGHPHRGDVLGNALAALPKIPVVQTNIFGRFDNPKEDAWTDFRLFISWTSAVQAARRSFRLLDEAFFRCASVAIYPIDPNDGPSPGQVQRFRKELGLQPDDIVFGRLSRPEPNKWTDLPIEGFRIAASQHSGIKLLLREPPAAVRRALENAKDRGRFVILPATNDPVQLALTIGSMDVALHTAITGESFGYGIAEPMNYGKPVIANSTPWLDQAQIELVRHDECGFIASTPRSIARRMLELSNDPGLRSRLGRNALAHIRALADAQISIQRLATILELVAAGRKNDDAQGDLCRARAAADYLDQHQFGHSLQEQMALRPKYYRTRFHEWRKAHRLAHLRHPRV